ncbi:hypothetical protein [Massilia sp. PWRC2]|uniref:hypothetical protein n=1 Tax=Massilia sp. PWRC2 TaxID=2804626 RepID=UPI003CF6B475
MKRTSKQEAFQLMERLCGPKEKSGHITVFVKPNGSLGSKFEYFAGGHDLVAMATNPLLAETKGK